MLVLNLIAVALANFLATTLNEGADSQISIVVVAILNKFQPWTQAILSLEKHDISDHTVPTWMREPAMILKGKARHQFLLTLEAVLTRLLDIPTFTSSFTNTKTTMAYYRLINDLKNACHLLSVNPEAKFVIPTDTKARRDLLRYITTMPIEDLELPLHRGVAASQEMMVCNSTGGAQEGRRAMRRFGLVAASYIRENIPPEVKPSLDLMIWVGLQATGAWQEIRYEWMQAYIAMGPGDSLVRSATRFMSAKYLRAWAQKHGHCQALAEIRRVLRRPRQDLEAAARVAAGLTPRALPLPPCLPPMHKLLVAPAPTYVHTLSEHMPSHVTISIPSPPVPGHSRVPANIGVSPATPVATVHRFPAQESEEMVAGPLDHLEMLAGAAATISRSLVHVQESGQAVPSETQGEGRMEAEEGETDPVSENEALDLRTVLRKEREENP